MLLSFFSLFKLPTHLNFDLHFDLTSFTIPLLHFKFLDKAKRKVELMVQSVSIHVVACSTMLFLLLIESWLGWSWCLKASFLATHEWEHVLVLWLVKNFRTVYIVCSLFSTALQLLEISWSQVTQRLINENCYPFRVSKLRSLKLWRLLWWLMTHQTWHSLPGEH